MTFLLLLALIYLVLGGLTALEVRVIGIPNVFHMCFPSNGCKSFGDDPDCPRRIKGRGPLTLFAYIGLLALWPLLWAAALLTLIIAILLAIGTLRF